MLALNSVSKHISVSPRFIRAVSSSFPSAERVAALKAEVVANGYPDHVLSARQTADLELILNGAFKPIDGFMTSSVYNSVVKSGRLPSGDAWPLPITLDVSKVMADKAKATKKLSLRDEEGRLLAVMDVEDIWKPNKEQEARECYGTVELSHPAKTAGEFNIGGKLHCVEMPVHYSHKSLRSPFKSISTSNFVKGTPEDVKKELSSKKWKKVAAYYSRRIMNFNERQALLEGSKSAGVNAMDPDYHIKVKCLNKLLQRSGFSPMTSLVTLANRGMGTREQFLKCLVSKNFDVLTEKRQISELEKMSKQIEMKLVSLPKVPTFTEKDLFSFLQAGKDIPETALPATISQLLKTRFPSNSRKGICLFFTGLSGSGKSTIGNSVSEYLLESATRPVVMLDGDVVRHNLSKGLGFSKEDRDLNILRIGFVASLITKCGGAVICAPIAPYANIRDKVREMVTESGGSFIEIHVATSLEECEKRDTKGLYAKARQGKIKNMTGIDDPYEAPKNPEMRLKTEGKTIQECTQTVWKYLLDRGLVTSD